MGPISDSVNHILSCEWCPGCAPIANRRAETFQRYGEGQNHDLRDRHQLWRTVDPVTALPISVTAERGSVQEI